SLGLLDFVPFHPGIVTIGINLAFVSALCADSFVASPKSIRRHRPSSHTGFVVVAFWAVIKPADSYR
ncbi:hypothetical protein N5J30_27715, partial [Klebsiella michiganensis]|uniref:hypothetical protein n=1 Tax=Klebsiella michiganensis TaxID=1134687 RepID=UPI00244B9CD0